MQTISEYCHQPNKTKLFGITIARILHHFTFSHTQKNKMIFIFRHDFCCVHPERITIIQSIPSTLYLNAYSSVGTKIWRENHPSTSERPDSSANGQCAESVHCGPVTSDAGAMHYANSTSTATWSPRPETARNPRYD